jgi:hypothetical protein
LARENGEVEEIETGIVIEFAPTFCDESTHEARDAVLPIEAEI